MNKNCVYIVFFLVSSMALGTAATDTSRHIDCKQWEVIDIAVKTKKNIKNPLALHFGAIFTHQSGKTLNILGFYNDGKEWTIRFSSSLTGNWTYKTYANSTALSGQTGTIRVSQNNDENQHGAIVVSKTHPQKFEYEDGTPYFLLAYELDWLFALDWNNAEDIPKTKALISDIATSGFNQVVMNVYAYDANWGERDKIKPEHNFAKPETFPYGGTNKKPNYTTLNINFFKHLDRVIHHLHEKGIVAHLMIYVWNKKVNWPVPKSKEDNLYFDYVVKRYQAFPNIVWDISKEALAYGRDDISYITNRIDRLKKQDAFDRLISVHDYAYCNAFPEKVDFISIQEWRPNLYDTMLDVYHKHKHKPIFNIEHGGYEKTTYSIFDGQYTDPEVCLDRNYQCIFAGAYSTYYWQNTSWYNIISSPFALPKDEQPAFQYYTHIRKLFKDYNFNHLYPEQYTFTPFALTNKKDTYLFYIYSGITAVHGDLNNTALRGKQVHIIWFDPLSGTYSNAGDYDFDKTNWMQIQVPAKLTTHPSVLILKEKQ